MFSTRDTIVAIATPPGRGGIGVVRISGPDAQSIARGLIARELPLQPRHATFTQIRLTPHAARAEAETVSASADVRGEGSVLPQGGVIDEAYAIDQVVATYFPAPHSYTGDDVVELSAHGSPVVLRGIVSGAMVGGARLAEPGEFTLRAFLNGRVDLPQAEAVADLIDAVTPRQARVAFDQLQGTLTRAIGEIDGVLFDLIARLEASVDFPDEGFHFIDPAALGGAIDMLRDRTSALLTDARRGRMIREGLQVAIIGKPNVGKSSVFNVLSGAARAIVTDIPGTTRDLVTERIDLDGLLVTLVDTAGLRETTDIVEREGVARAKRAQAVADLELILVDRSQPLDSDDHQIINQTNDNKRLIVINKIDMAPAWHDDAWQPDAISISATTGAGVDELRRRIAVALDVERRQDEPVMTNVRHIALVQRAYEALTRARLAIGVDGGLLSEEFLLADLGDARAAFEEVTGQRTSDDVLAHIFSHFCVGK